MYVSLSVCLSMYVFLDNLVKFIGEVIMKSRISSALQTSLQIEHNNVICYLLQKRLMKLYGQTPTYLNSRKHILCFNPSTDVYLSIVSEWWSYVVAP